MKAVCNTVFIDPGQQAGLAIFQDGELKIAVAVSYGDYPTLIEARKWLEIYTPDFVVIEAVGWRASAMRRCAKFSAGILIGALGLQCVPQEFINPGTWRKAVFGRSTEITKKMSLDYTAARGFETGDHNVAEACCIGWAWHWIDDRKTGADQ